MNQNKNQYQKLTLVDCNKECCICYENIGNNQDIYHTKCNHSYCLTCLDKWLKEHNNCPMCRTKLKDSNLNQSHGLPNISGEDVFWYVNEPIILSLNSNDTQNSNRIFYIPREELNYIAEQMIQMMQE